MYCSQCGEKIPDDSKFCPNCGVNTDLADSNVGKNADSTVKTGISNFTEDWKTWSGKKKILSLIVCCCLGWIIVSSILGALVPDNNTDDFSDESPKSYNISLSNKSDGVENTTSESVNASHLSSGAGGRSSDYSSGSSSSSSSSSSSHSYDTSSNSGGSYVGSSNTKKFHKPSCSHADRIKSGNKVFFSSRDDAVSRGYSPCGHCNP